MLLKSRTILIVCLLSIPAYHVSAQEDATISWWEPAKHSFPVVEGQGWRGEVKESFDRLPARAEGAVRDAVWNLSKHSAGLVIRFYSNAEEIQVRYQVGGKNYAMPHMPATGVSGVDLYAKDPHGNWLWAAGKYNFGDTITYRFSGLRANDPQHKMGREYRLYLPLYAQTKWLHIGVKETDILTPIPTRGEKPIVVYGTSIAQGGCASRPGNAWPAILGRAMDRPLINLGFSGNGRLETEVLEMISEIDAKIYILDCLPNLLPPRFSHEELKTLLLSAVRLLREKRPDTPILLAEHAGYTDEGINDGRKESFESVNKTVQGVYKELTAAGVQGLYHVPMAEFGQDINTTVDGTHQNDLGMLLYANGYEKVLREILHEPKGVISTTIPVTQRREPHNYEWEERHEAILKLSGSMGSSNVFMGNSILHFWGGKPEAKIRHGEDPWNKYIEKHGVVNMAFGWDRIENVLWRIYHDALEGYAPKKIFLMLGTNNMHLNTDDEIVEGLKVLVEAIHYRQPQATILLSGIFPRRNEEERLVGLNKMIGNTFSQKDYVQFVNPGPVLLGKDGRIDESNFSDGLHPNEKGYKLLGKAIGVLLD